MKELHLELPKSKLAKYRRLAEGIRESIKAGHLRPGEALPSSRDLAKKFRIHRHTVMNALAELAAEGWVESEEKKHYRVVATLPTFFLQARYPLSPSLAPRETKLHLARTLRIGDYSHAPNARYAFPSGAPDLGLFPRREFKSYLYDALSSRATLGYGDPAGQAQLREQVTTYLRRVRNVSDRSVMITNGSQEAIFFLAQLFLQPGDSVAVEGLGYPPALEALRFAGARIVPIRVDEEGLDVDDLEKQVRRRKIRLLYVTPLHQYPSTVTLSASRRLRLYELAYRHGLHILEDDYDHEFHYRSQPVAPLASFDPAQIVLYVSTFSKVLFPSARAGFVAVTPALERELAKLKRISSRQNDSLLQEAIGRWMESGGFERHLRRMRRAYEERLAAFERDLREARARHPELSWRSPDGGMALWLDTAQDSTRLAARARAKGVLVFPEQNFRVDGKAGTHLRLGFTAQNEAQNSAGLRALVSVL